VRKFRSSAESVHPFEGDTNGLHRVTFEGVRRSPGFGSLNVMLLVIVVAVVLGVVLAVQQLPI
jgi:hypothetical protein